MRAVFGSRPLRSLHPAAGLRLGRQVRWASSAASRSILFKATGSDKLGVVASFSRVLSNHGAEVRHARPSLTLTFS
eukprot:COSAG03_NODE_1523_length_3938_cov_3.053920_2_plen_76_part_00